MKNLKVLFTVLCVACATTVWGESFTIDFYNSDKLTSTSGTGLTSSNYSSFVSVSAGLSVKDVVTEVSVTGTVQYDKNGGLTLGTGTASAANTHKVAFTIGDDYKVTKCIVYATQYESGRILLNAKAADDGSLGAKGSKIETITSPLVWKNLDNLTNIEFTKDNGSGGNQKRITIYRIVCEYESSGSTETTVSFDPNTGSGSIDAMTGAANGTITLPDGSSFTKSGYTFIGWNTAKDGSGTFYAPATEFTIPAYNITLYAVWGFTIIWSLGGDVYTAGDPTTSVKSGERVSTLPTAPAGNAIGSCANTFMGWSTHDLGSETGQGDPGDLFTTIEGSPVITQNTIFYAVFATKQNGN